VLRQVAKGAKVFNTMSEATAAAASQETGKCWATLSLTKDSMAEVHTALKEGSSTLGVVMVATSAPVSQMEVLRAMEYGGVYVAAAAMTSAGPALTGASSFAAGPSLVLLATAEAIKGDENWTAFTYDPRREDAGSDAFAADSERVRTEIKGFLSRQNLLTLIAKKSLPAPASENAEAGELAQGLSEASKTVTILYSSDTGHAEECAKAVARQCRNGGFASSAVRCGTMDSFDVGALAAEPLVVFCVATAGKGEFCGNGRGFFSKLSGRSDLDLKDMKYCMFGLGDSHYWGKGTEESKVNFAKPARELDELLESLGAQRFMPIGFTKDSCSPADSRARASASVLLC